ncbi:MAG TPA: FUSC family protein [Acetobacteraceae bacterium]|jgi:uncharacterized membrane protein YccC|nr:FUSC family protein [Acetobacteraceae bacterium]
MPTEPAPAINATAALRAWLTCHRSQLWLALRMTIAASLAYALATALGLPQGYWAVLTTIIVTQNSVGGSLKAAAERLVGSVCGALVGAAAAIMLPAHTPLVLGVALVAAVAPLALLTAFSPGFRIAPVTAIIVLLSTGTATLGPLGYALDRVLEIALGAVIGLGVSLLIAPARAHAQVRDVASETAALLADVMAGLVPAVCAGTPDVGTLPMRIHAALSRLDASVAEAARERRSRLSDQPDPKPLYRTLRRLRQDIFALNRTLGEALPNQVQAALEAPWSALARAVVTTLRSLAQALPERQLPDDDAALQTSAAAFNAAIDAVWRDELTRSLPADVVGRILGSVFLVEQLLRDLGDLLERVREAAAPSLRD